MHRHVILTNGRSGSNHLANVLNSHPQVVNYGEVLGEWTMPARVRRQAGAFPDDTPAYLDWILSSPVFFVGAQGYSAVTRAARRTKPRIKLWSQVSTIGIKEFEVNFTRFGLREYLAARDDIKVINLFRSNVLARYVSVLGVEQTGVVAARRGASRKAPRIHVPVNDLVPQLEILEGEADSQRDLAESISGPRVLHIRYEDYFASPSQRDWCNARVFDFLELPRVQVASEHAKVLPRTFDDSLDNVADVRALLRGTHFERYLDGPV